MICLLRARQSVRAALPVIAAAATADGVYALLTGLGVLAVARAGVSGVLAVASVVFLLLCAYLLWPRTRSLSAVSAVGVAALNPPAALLWLALGGTLAAHPHGSEVVFLALGAASATASWFMLLAIVSHHSQRWLTATVMRGLSVTVSLTLVALACVRAGTLLG